MIYPFNRLQRDAASSTVEKLGVCNEIDMTKGRNRFLSVYSRNMGQHLSLDSEFCSNNQFEVQTASSNKYPFFLGSCFLGCMLFRGVRYHD